MSIAKGHVSNVSKRESFCKFQASTQMAAKTRGTLESIDIALNLNAAKFDFIGFILMNSQRNRITCLILQVIYPASIEDAATNIKTQSIQKDYGYYDK